MTATILIYIDQIASIVAQYPRQVVTECWPWIVLGAGALAVGGLAAIKIVSAILSVKGRELAKPAIEE